MRSCGAARRHAPGARCCTPWRQRRFYWKGDKLYQRSMPSQPDVEWEVVQVVDTITPGRPHYSEKSRIAKTFMRDGGTWGACRLTNRQLAHGNEQDDLLLVPHVRGRQVASAAICPMTANQRKPMLHNEGPGYAQLHFLQLPGAARRRVHAGRGWHGHRTSHRAGALRVRRGGEFAEPESRLDLLPAADGLCGRIQRTGFQHLRSAHRACDGDAQAAPIATSPRRRQQRLDGAT